MGLSYSDAIELVMMVISLSVFVIKPSSGILRFYPLYFFLDFLQGIYMTYTSHRGIHNTGVENAYLIAVSSFLFLVIRGFIVNVQMRRIILVATLILALFEAINLIFIQKTVGFNPINFTIQSLFTVICCIYYFFELFHRTEAPSLSRLPSFWITTAILFNTVLSFPMWALIAFMQEGTIHNYASWELIFDNIAAIFNIITTITYVLYSIGFLCRIRTSKSIL